MRPSSAALTRRCATAAAEAAFNTTRLAQLSLDLLAQPHRLELQGLALLLECALRLGARTHQSLLVRRHGRVQLGSGVLFGEGFLIEQLGRFRLGRLELELRGAPTSAEDTLLAQILGERLLGLKCAESSPACSEATLAVESATTNSRVSF
jgi:hypothetical protein